METRIIRRLPVDSSALCQSGLHPLLARIYAARGVTSPAELDYSLPALLPYHSMKGVDAAVREIARSVMAGERILVVGDFDCDGATSSALAVLALRAMGAAQVDYLVPNRFEYGYGLSPEIVAVAAQREPALLITVDNGVSSHQGVAAAQQAGMRVVVTDHHLPGHTLPPAEALVNPNQPGCGFPAKQTCGVGVIFYVMSALRRHLQAEGWFAARGSALPNMGRYLDLVALGTVADVVGLEANNRVLVHQGLARIRAGHARPGLLALLEVAGRRRERLTASDLGFVVGPRLNAAGRLEDMAIGIECLLTDDPDRARELAQELDRLNRERREIEQAMQQQALELLKPELLRPEQLSGGAQLPAGLCLFSEGWHEGVIGILASRIKERVHRPVIAFAATASGELKGSARSIPGLHIRDALDAIAARHPGLLSKFGGHAMAAGLSLSREQFTRFQDAFAEEAQRQLSAEDFQARIESDGALSAAEMTLEMAALLRDAGPWGQSFPEPVFDDEFHLIQQRIVGERHLKLVVSEPASGHCLDVIAFNVDLEQWPTASNRVHLAYRLDINEFRGQTSLQLQAVHLQAMT